MAAITSVSDGGIPPQLYQSEVNNRPAPENPTTQQGGGSFTRPVSPRVIEMAAASKQQKPPVTPSPKENIAPGFDGGNIQDTLKDWEKAPSAEFIEWSVGRNLQTPGTTRSDGSRAYEVKGSEGSSPITFVFNDKQTKQNTLTIEYKGQQFTAQFVDKRDAKGEVTEVTTVLTSVATGKSQTYAGALSTLPLSVGYTPNSPGTPLGQALDALLAPAAK
jgi:hypothetical protein